MNKPITREWMVAASYKHVKYFERKTFADKCEIGKTPTVDSCRFIKPGEDPDKAIKRLMASRKPKKDPRYFPKFGVFKSTADYVARYRNMNNPSLCLDFKNLRADGFAIPEGDDVIFSEIDSFAEDLV